MAETPTVNAPPATAVASLVPAGMFTGKPGLPLGRPFTVIGSRQRSNLHLVSKTISNVHACLIHTEGGYYIRDLASRTHVFVNGRQVRETALKDGDTIEVGAFSFRFDDPSGTRLSDHDARPPDALLEVDGTTLIPFDGRTVLIGRRPTCDVPLLETSVSTSHALIFELNGQRFIRDLGSRTGTMVNGKAIHHQPLQFGDRIRIGETDFRYLAAEAQAEPAELEMPEDEPLGLDFAEPGVPVQKPLVEEEHAPIPLESEPAPAPAQLHTVQPVPEVPLPLAPAAHETSVVTANVADVSEAPPLPMPAETEPPVAAPPHEEDLGLDFWTEEPPKPAAAEVPAAEPPPIEMESEPDRARAPFEAAEDPWALTPVELEPLHLEPEPEPEQEAPEAESPEPVAEETVVAEEPVATEEKLEAPQVPPPVPAEPEVSATEMAPPPVVVDPVEAMLEPIEPRPEPTTPAAESPEQPELVEVAPEEMTPEPASAEAPPEPHEEIESPLAPPIEPLLGSKDEGPAEVSSEAVDLSAVKFGDEPSHVTADEAVAESAPVETDVTPPPAPLLDLGVTPPVTEAPLAPSAEEPAAAEPAPAEPIKEKKPKRKRGWRRKSKGQKDEVVEPAAEAPPEAAGVPVLTPEAEPQAEEPGVFDLTAIDPVPVPFAEALVEPPPAVPDAPITADLSPLTPEGHEVTAPVEVIDTTEPTPESALELEQVLESESQPPAPEHPADAAMTDTSFGRAVQDFSGTELGSIVESPAPAPAPVESPAPTPAPVAAPEPIIAREEKPAPAPAPSPDETHAENVFNPETDLEEPPPLAGGALEEDLSLTSEFPLRVEEEVELPPAAVQHSTELDLADMLAPDQPELDLAAPPPPVAQTVTAAPEVVLPPPVAADLAPPAVEPAPALPDLPPPPAAAPMDPFFGMGRDMGTFIGGMPLPLARDEEAAPQTPAAEAPTAREEKPELFDESPEKLDAIPEALAPIPDVTAALAEPPAAPAAPLAPAPAPKAESPPRAKRPAPPPPPKTAPLRAVAAAAGATARNPLRNPFDVSPEDVPVGGVAVPPFTGRGPATRGQVTTGFDGLAMPPVREADVFSSLAVPQFDEAIFGPRSQEVPPMAPLAPRAQPGGEAPAATLPAKSQRPRRDAIPPNRQPGSKRPQTPPAPGAAAPPPRAPEIPPSTPAAPEAPTRRRNVRVLVSIIVLIAILAVAAVVLFFVKPKSTVQADLHFSGLKNLPPDEQRARVDIVRKRLELADLHNVAANRATEEGVGPGFLNDAFEYEELEKNSQFYPEEQKLQFRRQTSDPDTDRRRMNALLFALYTEAKPFRDKAASVTDALDKAQQNLRDIERQQAGAQARLRQLTEAVRASGPSAQDLLLDPLTAQVRLKKQLDDLSQKADEAERVLRQRRVELEAAQAPPAPAAAADPDADPQVKQFADSVRDLTARLAAARAVRSGKSEDAAKEFDAALKQFEQQLGAAPDAASSDPKLSAYLTSAREAQASIRDASRELADRQKSDRDALAQLKKRLADTNEAHLKEVWASDPQLKSMAQDLSVLNHRYNAALGSGLADEAKKLAAQVSQLNDRIDARRALLAADDQYGDRLRQMVQEALDRMEQQRKRDEQLVQDRLKALETGAPAIDKLPAEQQATAEKLAGQLAALKQARQHYATVMEISNADADAKVKRLEQQVVDQQAKLDARKKEVAQAGAKALSPDQQREHDLAVAAARKAVADAEDKAMAANQAYFNLRKLDADMKDLQAARVEVAQRGEEQKLAQEQVEARQKEAAATPVVEQPEDNAVTIVYGKDQRFYYLLGTIATCALIAGLVFWFGGSKPQAPAPLAAVAVSHEVLSPHAYETDYEPTDDEEPLPV